MVERSVERVRNLLEAAAAELESRREDVLSKTLIWPSDGLDAADCAAFLLAIDERLAVLDAAGYVTVPDGRFPLLSRSGTWSAGTTIAPYWTGSTWISRRVSSLPCWERAGPGRAPCCGRWPGWT